jgi:hypothetical protein
MIVLKISNSLTENFDQIMTILDINLANFHIDLFLCYPTFFYHLTVLSESWSILIDSINSNELHSGHGLSLTDIMTLYNKL